MIKVLHILPKVPVGGVGSFLKNTQRNINSDFSFDYLIIENVNGSTFIDEVTEMGSKVFLLNQKLKIKNFYKIKNNIEKVLKYNNGYDIAHLHSANIVTLVFPICKKYNIKTRIVHSHSTKYSDSIIKSLRNCIIELPMCFYTTNYIACSKEAGKFLFRRKPFDVVYNGIDLKRYNINNKLFEKKEKTVLALVGNFVPVKNHKFLLKVFIKLLTQNSNYELWLFGDGKLKEKIKKRVNIYKIENKVKFWGRVNNIEYYYNFIDILLLPSKYEGFPVSAMEAQAYGIPIIASTNVTNEINFYNDDFFIGINKKNVDEWVKKIMDIDLNNKENKIIAFKKSMFTIEQTTRKLENCYYKYLKGN